MPVTIEIDVWGRWDAVAVAAIEQSPAARHVEGAAVRVDGRLHPLAGSGRG